MWSCLPAFQKPNMISVPYLISQLKSENKNKYNSYSISNIATNQSQTEH